MDDAFRPPVLSSVPEGSVRPAIEILPPFRPRPVSPITATFSPCSSSSPSPCIGSNVAYRAWSAAPCQEPFQHGQGDMRDRSLSPARDFGRNPLSPAHRFQSSPTQAPTSIAEPSSHEQMVKRLGALEAAIFASQRRAHVQSPTMPARAAPTMQIQSPMAQLRQSPIQAESPVQNWQSPVMQC